MARIDGGYHGRLITESLNLGARASHNNDENLVIDTWQDIYIDGSNAKAPEFAFWLSGAPAGGAH